MPNEESMYRKNSDGSFSQFMELTGSNVTDAQTLWTPGMLYNGATSDMPRGNTEGTLLASAARTAATSGPVITNYSARGVLLTLNVTAAPTTPGAGGLQVQIYAVDPISGSGILLNNMPALITALGKYGYELYPGSSTSGTAGTPCIQQRTSGALPRSWFVYVIAADAQSYTYSIGYSLIL